MNQRIEKRVTDKVNRQIGIEFGLTTAAISYRDYTEYASGIEKMVVFNEEMEVFDEKGCWFVEDLLSKEENRYENACFLVEKFMVDLYKQYKMAVEQESGITIVEETTVITYPAGCKAREQEVIKKAAEKAGFVNVVLIHEAEAAVQYSLMYETGRMEPAFEKNTNGWLGIKEELIKSWSRPGFLKEDGVIAKGAALVPTKPQTYWEAERPFYEGLAAVKKDGKWGFIDVRGELKIACVWDRVKNFQGGKVAVLCNDAEGYINRDGEIIVPLVHACKWDDAGDFHEGLAPVCKGKKWGYIDQQGKLVIPCKWISASSFSEGLAKVEEYYYNTSAEEYEIHNYYIDKQGKEVILCKWHDAKDFSEGLACVRKGGKYGYIDKQGIPIGWSEYEI